MNPHIITLIIWNCKMMIECPGDGWIPGRGKIKECE